MICEKCGKEMQSIHVNMFDCSGADSLWKYDFQECEEDAVVIDTNPAWVGCGLSDEEQLETIKCPHCHQFPFKNTEIQVYDVVRIVCFKSPPSKEDNVQPKPIDCIRRMSNDVPSELYEGIWGGEETT